MSYYLICTARNASDLMEILDFTSLTEVIKQSCSNNLRQSCGQNVWQSTCIKSVHNLRQTCYQQVRESDANASRYRLDVCEASGLQQQLAQLAVAEKKMAPCRFYQNAWRVSSKNT